MPFYRVGAGTGSGGGTVSRITKQVALSGSEDDILIDISKYISDYADKTNANFIVELHGLSSTATTATTATISHTYEASTGILTITSSSTLLPFSVSGTGTIEVQVDIIGTVEVVPEPKSDLPDTFALTLSVGNTDSSGAAYATFFGADVYKYYTFTASGGDATLSVGEYAVSKSSTKVAIPSEWTNGSQISMTAYYNASSSGHGGVFTLYKTL